MFRGLPALPLELGDARVGSISHGSRDPCKFKALPGSIVTRSRRFPLQGPNSPKGFQQPAASASTTLPKAPQDEESTLQAYTRQLASPKQDHREKIYSDTKLRTWPAQHLHCFFFFSPASRPCSCGGTMSGEDYVGRGVCRTAPFCARSHKNLRPLLSCAHPQSLGLTSKLEASVARFRTLLARH